MERSATGGSSGPAVSAAHSVAYGPGLRSCADVQLGRFKVFARRADGGRVYSGGAALAVRVLDAHGQALEATRVSDNDDGTYDVVFRPRRGVVGAYRVHVALEGQPLPRSPYRVRVLEGCERRGVAARSRAHGPGLIADEVVSSASMLQKQRGSSSLGPQPEWLLSPGAELALSSSLDDGGGGGGGANASLATRLLSSSASPHGSPRDRTSVRPASPVAAVVPTAKQPMPQVPQLAINECGRPSATTMSPQPPSSPSSPSLRTSSSATSAGALAPVATAAGAAATSNAKKRKSTSRLLSPSRVRSNTNDAALSSATSPSNHHHHHHHGGASAAAPPHQQQQQQPSAVASTLMSRSNEASPPPNTGRLRSFVVEVYDEAGFRVTQGGDVCVAKIKGPDGREKTLQVLDGFDGTHTVVYDAQQLGQYRIDVLLNGERLPSFPLRKSIRRLMLVGRVNARTRDEMLEYRIQGDCLVLASHSRDSAEPAASSTTAAAHTDDDDDDDDDDELLNSSLLTGSRSEKAAPLDAELHASSIPASAVAGSLSSSSNEANQGRYRTRIDKPKSATGVTRKRAGGGGSPPPVTVDTAQLQLKMEELEQLEVHCTSMRSMLRSDRERELTLLVKSLACEEWEAGEFEELQVLSRRVDEREAQMAQLEAEMQSVSDALNALVGKRFDWSFVPTYDNPRGAMQLTQ